MKKNLHEQIQRYLAGLANSQEVADLQETLKEDAEARGLYLDYANLDVALSKLSEAAKMVGSTMSGSISDRVTATPRATLWSSWFQWPSLVVAGACAVLFFAATTFVYIRHQPAHAVLAEASGDVRVSRGKETITCKAGFVLHSGDWLLTGSDSSATIKFTGEKTRLTFASNAKFGLVSAGIDKKINLTAGTMHASVAHQLAGHPMLVRTPTAKAEVLGTEFVMSAANVNTQMKVEDGRVLIARTADENGVVVESLQSVTVTESDPVVVTMPAALQLVNLGLLAHWTFDEGAGLIAADSSGNGRNLTLSTNGSWGEGRYSKCLDLHTGKADVESPDIKLPEVFTVAVWLKINHGGPARNQPLLGCQSSAVGMDEFWLTLRPTFPGSGIVLGVPGLVMGSEAYSKPGVIIAGKWHHLVVITDSRNGKASFYLDGQDVTELDGLRRDFKIGGSLLIGRRVKGGPLPFDGQIDDVRLYGRALSPSEITMLAGGKDALP